MGIVADVGGTHARFACVNPAGELSEIRRFETAGYDSFDQVLDAYLAGIPGHGPPRGLAVAVAGPVDGGRAKLTNLPWQVSTVDLSAALGGAPVHVVNDLEAVAMLLPHLEPGDHEPLRAGPQPAGARPLIAVNVGTGFGAACAIPAQEHWHVLATEAGHMRLAPVDAREGAYLGGLHSVEDLLSGAGLARLREARAESDALGLFSAVLGRICGDLVLATGAWGGVFLCGGVVRGVAESLDRKAFFTAFDDKGAMRSRMAKVAVSRLLVDEPALRGLARAPWEWRPLAGVSGPGP